MQCQNMSESRCSDDMNAEEMHGKEGWYVDSELC